MYSGDDEGGKSQAEEIEGVRVPCRDAKRRVWQAIDLLKQQHKTHNGSPRAVSVRQRNSPSSEKNPHRAASGDI
jgi:hypothetical protein